MTNIISWLDGKKTYIGLAILFIAGGLNSIKAINTDTYNFLLWLGGFITTYGVNAVIHKFLNK